VARTFARLIHRADRHPHRRADRPGLYAGEAAAVARRRASTAPSSDQSSSWRRFVAVSIATRVVRVLVVSAVIGQLNVRLGVVVSHLESDAGVPTADRVGCDPTDEMSSPSRAGQAHVHALEVNAGPPDGPASEMEERWTVQTSLPKVRPNSGTARRRPSAGDQRSDGGVPPLRQRDRRPDRGAPTGQPPARTTRHLARGSAPDRRQAVGGPAGRYLSSPRWARQPRSRPSGSSSCP